MSSKYDIDGYFPCIMNRCDGRLMHRVGKHGVFYGCSNYPECTYTRTRRDVEEEYTAAEIGEYGNGEDVWYGW